jgi:hypothetical protein
MPSAAGRNAELLLSPGSLRGKRHSSLARVETTRIDDTAPRRICHTAVPLSLSRFLAASLSAPRKNQLQIHSETFILSSTNYVWFELLDLTGCRPKVSLILRM